MFSVRSKAVSRYMWSAYSDRTLLESLVTMVTWPCHPIKWAKIERLTEPITKCDKGSTVEKGVICEQRRDIIPSLEELGEVMPTLQHARGS